MNQDLIKFSIPESINKTIETNLKTLSQEKFVERIWQKDHTLWSDSPEEITNRLDWLIVGQEILDQSAKIDNLLAGLAKDGITNVYVLGMGGSSLAPDIFSKVFTSQFKVTIIDTTDPSRITDLEKEMPLDKSVYIVATKSGGTAETLSLFKYFYQKISKISSVPGNSFVAITDPGSKLEKLATDLKFRQIFRNNPNIGGRYSALSFFGMVPAAIAGADYKSLLSQSNQTFDTLKDENAPLTQATLKLGVLMGALSLQNQDKLTFIIPDDITIVAEWIEQLIAESTGKNGKGILPVIGEQPTTPDNYGTDRIFINYTFAGATPYAAQVQALIDANYPVVTIDLADFNQLGVHFAFWEFATAVAGAVMGIQPFNQPNVESAKVSARKMIDIYKETGELPPLDTVEFSKQTLEKFLSDLSQYAYISIHGYVNPNPVFTQAFKKLQTSLRNKTKKATTFGFGPRFLHSTGQLHKGDAGNGVFIQFVTKNEKDLPIPDEAGSDQSQMPFGVLKTAQALGDGQALKQNHRKMITYLINENDADKIATLID
jgi:glucose-6-phosphate isomerase